MPPKSISEKTPRVYRSELRQRQAEATRTRIIEAATELFAADGYARTTLAKIAAAAGVSAETVQGQGTKAALLIAACEHAAVGIDGEQNIFNVDQGRALRDAADAAAAMDLTVDVAAQIHERTARLSAALIGAADADADLDRYVGDFVSGITGQVRRVLEVYRDRDWLRDDINFDELVETAAVLTSVETYLRITHRDGWSLPDYRRWLRRMLAETIFAVPKAN